MLSKIHTLLLVFAVASVMLTSSALTVTAEGNGKGNDNRKGNPDQGLSACENPNGKAQQKNSHCTVDEPIIGADLSIVAQDDKWTASRTSTPLTATISNAGPDDTRWNHHNPIRKWKHWN